MPQIRGNEHDPGATTARKKSEQLQASKAEGSVLCCHFVKFLLKNSDDLWFHFSEWHTRYGRVFAWERERERDCWKTALLEILLVLVVFYSLLCCCLIHFTLTPFSRMSSFICSHTLVGIIIQHLMSCKAGDWMVLTSRPCYWSWWQCAGRPGRSLVQTNVCLWEWCPRRDAERRELTGLLASLLIPETGKGTGPNKACGPDCLASHRFINVKSSPL